MKRHGECASTNLLGLVTVALLLWGAVCEAGEVAGVHPVGSSLAVSFAEHDYRLQMLSFSGPWGGFSSGTGVTVEAWVRQTNCFTLETPLFVYSIRMPLEGRAEAKELSLALASMPSTGYRGLPVWRYKGALLMPAALSTSAPTSRTCGQWDHVVATLDFASGTFAAYLNGTQLYADSVPPSTSPLPPPLPGGFLQLGADIRVSLDGRTELTASSSAAYALDVFRVYNRTLLGTEVEAIVWAFDPVPSAQSALLLHWRFDIPHVAVETDLSGNNNHGLWGASGHLDFPTIYMHTTPRGVVRAPVHPPASVISSVPVVGASAVTSLVLPGTAVELLLAPPQSFASCTLLSVPSVGALRLPGANVTAIEPPLSTGAVLPACRVRYWAPDSSVAFDSGAAVTFRFHVNGSGLEGSAAVYATSACLPPEYPPMELIDDASGPFDRRALLGGLCSDGRMARVEVVRLPKGVVAVMPHYRLADPLNALLEDEELPDMDEFLALNSSVLMRAFPALTVAPAEVTVNDPGAVVFAALPGRVGALATYIEYRWLSPFADSSVIRRMDVYRQGPESTVELLPPSFTPDPFDKGDSSLRIELRAVLTDDSVPVDEEVDAIARPPKPSAEHDLTFHVTRGPFFGTLYQVTEDEEEGAPLSRFGLESPLLEYEATVVPEYRSAWGPAWSSQQTACPACCSRQATCNSEYCTEQLVFLPQCEADAASYHASNLVDGVEGTLYKSGCLDCGRQWFVVGIAEPLHIRGVQLALGGVDGHVTAISGAAAYAGNFTEWVPIWLLDGEPEPRAVVDGLAYFEPLLCEYQPALTRWLRVEFDTSNASAVPGFGGVRVEGTLDPHSSAVHSSRSELLYRPLPGLFTAIKDTVEVAASDCGSWSEAETIAVPRVAEDGGAARGSVFGELQQVTVPLRQRVEVELNLAAPWEFMSTRLEALLKGPLPTSVLEVADFELVLEAQAREEGEPPLLVFDASTGEELPSDEATTLGRHTRVLVEHRTLSPTLLHFQLTLQAVVYRLGLKVASRCPAGASAFECALSAAECFEVDCERYSSDCGLLGSGEATIVFDTANMRCKMVNTGSERNLTQLQITLGAAFAALLVLAVFVVFLWFKKRTRRRSGSAPGQGEMVTLVTTDIHGSTTLWDAFPEQVAADIALHHECLRASLKLCNGYEIATEGDSFKCAFSTPEDAICWSIRSQLDLLCAPWSKNLEDGGHAALVSRGDWANCEGAPVVSQGAADVIDGLAGLDCTSHGRTALEGAFMRPRFDPKLVVGSEFCKQWAISKGEEESTAAYGPEALLIPVFRGLRVRVGIHTGVADVVETNPITRRVMYGGKVAKIAKLVSDAPCGGQIVMSGDTLAEVQSMQDLMARVATMCAGWRHGEMADDPCAPAALSVLSLGSHLLTELPPLKSQMGRGKAAKIEDRPASVVASDDDATDASVGAFSSSARLGHGKPSRRVTLTAVGVPKMGHNCALPPSLGGDQLIDDVFDLVDEESSSSSSDEEEKSGDAGEGAAGEDAVPALKSHRSMLRRNISCISRGEKNVQRQAEAELREAQELIMVVPWPLKARAMYYPPVSSVKALTPSWDAAPKASGVTILFAFLEGAAQLKDMEEKEEAAQALFQLQSVVRSQLVRHKGYEVEVEEGNMVFAFHSAPDAVSFSVNVQQALMAVQWSPSILGHPWAAEQRTAANELIFRGLRLAIGMCSGNAMRVQPCIRTGKMEYYGPIMNHAARTAVAAHGGQVLLHESSWNKVVEGKEEGKEVGDVVFRNMGSHALKGITRSVHIIQAIPSTLASRSFSAIKTKSIQLAMRRPSGPAPLMKLGKLESYLAGVDGISSPAGTDKQFPSRRVPKSVRMPDMSLAASLKRMKDFVTAALPFGGLRNVARRVLGMQRERVSPLRRPSMLASVADQAMAASRNRSQMESARAEDAAGDEEQGLKSTSGRPAWADTKSCPEISGEPDTPRSG